MYSETQKQAYNKGYHAGKARKASVEARLLRVEEILAVAVTGLGVAQRRITMLEADKALAETQRALLEAMVRQAEEWST